MKPNLFQRIGAGIAAFNQAGQAGQAKTASAPNNVQPTQADVPSSWLTTPFGPGSPLAPMNGVSGLRGELQEAEPQSFQYLPNVNMNIAPRIAYGLSPFWLLKYYAETVPEVAMCRRLLTDEIKNLAPQIVNKRTGEVVAKAEVINRVDKQTGQLRKVHTGQLSIAKRKDLAWLVTFPDRKQPWPIWISRLMYNKLVYDAGCFYLRPGPDGIPTALRVLDGSTIFCIVDESGEQPDAPQPAFSQILFGQVRSWLSNKQLWYRPSNLRVDSPYGISPIEDSIMAVRLLEQMWSWETEWYTEGNMPEAFLEPDPKQSTYWTVERLIEHSKSLTARIVGNKGERRRFHYLPPGVKVANNPKKAEWSQQAYETALFKVAFTFGVHPSELGMAPGAGLGGKGYQEQGFDAHVRMGTGPNIEYIESAIDAVLAMMGETDLACEMVPAGVELDNVAREARAMRRWEKNLYTRNQTLGEIGMPPLEGPEGKAYYNDAKSLPVELAPDVEEDAGVEDEPEQPTSNEPTAQEKPATESKPKKATATNIPVDDNPAFEKLWGIDDLAKHCGVCVNDDSFFGGQVSRVLPITSPWLGANRSEIVAVKNSDGELRPAMFKPYAGEWEALQDWIGGPQYVREEAAYLVDRVLGFYLCPVAFTTNLDGELGAVLLYVRGQAPKAADEYMPQWTMRAAVFDYIIGQADRYAHNWLTHAEDSMRPVLIDHGLTFPTSNMRVNSGFVEVMQGQELPADILAALGELEKDVVWDDIRALVGETATEIAQARLRYLLEAKVMPSLESRSEWMRTPSGKIHALMTSGLYSPVAYGVGVAEPVGSSVYV